MAYNTLNPLGSKDPRDLYDNATNFDHYANGELPFYPNRFGVQKLSIEGMNQAFNTAQDGRAQQFEAVLAGIGFVWIGDYGAGLTFTTRQQYTVRGDLAYTVANDTTLPFTLTGNWATDEAKLKLINSDQILRSDLAQPDGAALVGFNGAETYPDNSVGGGLKALSEKSTEQLSITDFMTPAQVADAKTGAPTMDSSVVLQTALNTGRDLRIPQGITLRVEQPVNVTAQRIYGGGTIIKAATTLYALKLLGRRTTIEGLKFRPEAVSTQPHTDIKLGDGASEVIIRDNDFFTTIAARIYSAISAAIDPAIEGTDFPYVNSVAGLLIEGNTFRGYTRPLYLHCVENFSILGNLFRGSAYDAIRIREAIGWGVISNNQFHEIGDPDSTDEQTRDAVDTAFSGNRLVISNNMVRGTRYVGFDVKGLAQFAPGFLSTHIIIQGNVIEGTLRSGISVAEAAASAPDYIVHFTIADNHVVGCNTKNSAGGGGVGDGGILVGGSVRYAAVRGNHCVANHGRGIVIARGAPAGTQVRNFSITENFCINNRDQGISMAGAMHGVVRGNQCINDTNNHTIGPGAGTPIVPNQNMQLYGLAITTDGAEQVQTLMISENILMNNVNAQVVFAGANMLSTNLAKFSDNIEVGPEAYNTSSNRARWAQRGRVLWGNGTAPLASEGTFSAGDVIFNKSPSASGKIGLVCTVGGTPGTWKAFGPIDA